MFTLRELTDRIRFWRLEDRIGPDIPWTHWRLHFRSTMRALCRAKFARFGDGAEFRPGAYAVECRKISIGANVVIRPGTMLFADPLTPGIDITIEDDAMLASGIHIYVVNHLFDDPSRPIVQQGYTSSSPVILRSGCWIGANSILLPGVEIGRNSVVGAGSVVTRSVPPGVVVAGNPARILREIAGTGRTPA